MRLPTRRLNAALCPRTKRPRCPPPAYSTLRLPTTSQTLIMSESMADADIDVDIDFESDVQHPADASHLIFTSAAAASTPDDTPSDDMDHDIQIDDSAGDNNHSSPEFLSVTSTSRCLPSTIPLTSTSSSSSSSPSPQPRNQHNAHPSPATLPTPSSTPPPVKRLIFRGLLRRNLAPISRSQPSLPQLHSFEAWAKRAVVTSNVVASSGIFIYKEFSALALSQCIPLRRRCSTLCGPTCVDTASGEKRRSSR